MAKDDNMIKVGALAMVAVTIGLGAYMSSISRTVNDVIALKPQLAQNQEDIQNLEDWRDDWVSGGELPADVRQTLNIEFLKQQIEETRSRVKALEDIVKQLEINQ